MDFFFGCFTFLSIVSFQKNEPSFPRYVFNFVLFVMRDCKLHLHQHQIQTAIFFSIKNTTVAHYLHNFAKMLSGVIEGMKHPHTQCFDCFHQLSPPERHKCIIWNIVFLSNFQIEKSEYLTMQEFQVQVVVAEYEEEILFCLLHKHFSMKNSHKTVCNASSFNPC